MSFCCINYSTCKSQKDKEFKSAMEKKLKAKHKKQMVLICDRVLCDGAFHIHSISTLHTENLYITMIED